MSSIRVESKEIKMVDPDLLIPNPRNNNKHPIEQVDRLKKIITRQGFRVPIEVSNQSGFIVCGHLRHQVAIELKMNQVPVIYMDFESPAIEYAHLTAENEIARWANLDTNQLYEDLKELQLDDIELLGIEDFEIPEIEELDPQTDEDEVPEVENPITKRGDIWLLGKHRLMCGDSTMIDDVEKLMNGEKADMVFTDPPYGMFLDTDYTKMNGSKKNTEFSQRKNVVGGKEYKKVIGDNDDFNDDFINNIFGYFNYCGEIFLWGADYYSELIPDKNNGSWIVWDKRDNNENFDKMFGSAFELCWSKNKHKRDIARVRWCGVFGTEKEFDKKRHHPTQKPVDLITWFFEKWCENMKSCVDLFGGSGSTMLACEKHNKICYTMELDEHYCDVIINRWQNYTGKQAVLESTGESYNDLKEASNG